MESICRHVLDEDRGVGQMILSRQLEKLFQRTFFWKGQSPDASWKFLVDTCSHIATLAVSLARRLEVVLFPQITVVMDSSLTLICLPWTFWMSIRPPDSLDIWGGWYDEYIPQALSDQNAFTFHLDLEIWWNLELDLASGIDQDESATCIAYQSLRLWKCVPMVPFPLARPAPFRWRVGNNFQTTTSVGKEWGRFWWDDLTDIRESRYSRSKHWNHIGFDSLKWPPQISPSRHLIHWSCSSGQKRWAILIPKWQLCHWTCGSEISWCKCDLLIYLLVP